MNAIQVISKESFVPDSLFMGSPFRTGYLWKNIVIEKRISTNWAYRMYKGSIFDSFWSVLISPVG